MPKVTIFIAYVSGTSAMLAACLASIKRHNDPRIALIYIVTAEGGVDVGLQEVIQRYRGPGMPLNVYEVEREHIVPMREHGSILDRAIGKVLVTEYLLTLDSDCFPVADDWLDELSLMLGYGWVVSSGILHPWVPPPEELSANSIERRVRSQLCSSMTHVACQLVRTEDALSAIRAGHGYATGDDTGFGLIGHISRLPRYTGKARCIGYSLKRCPRPDVPSDLEFNRYSCLVYGDKMIHVGGHSRITRCGEEDVCPSVSWAVSRILEECGAEFLLEPENSYLYRFDKEEEVAKEKFQRMFGLESQRMKL
jgi:hypothetical protein